MPLGDTLFKSSRYPEHVYFPTNAIVALLSRVKEDALTEIAVVGNEGVLGISQLLMNDISPGRAVVLSAGYGFRLKGQLMQNEYNHGGSMLRLALRYAKVLTIQMTVAIGCQRQHTVEQQLCRLLLLSLDRLHSNDLTMPQDLMANLLGIHQDEIADAASKLQRAGLIRYRRGHMDALDRAGMCQAVCECYGMVTQEVDRMVADIPANHSLPQSPGDVAMNS